MWMTLMLACFQEKETAAAAPASSALAAATQWDGHHTWARWDTTGEQTCGTTWHASGPASWDEAAGEATAELTLTLEGATGDPCFEAAAARVVLAEGAGGWSGSVVMMDASGATVNDCSVEATVDDASHELAYATPDDVDAYSDRDVCVGALYLL
jgi:hypothetical protein